MTSLLMFAGAVMAQVNRARVEFGFEKESAVINVEFAENSRQMTILDSLVCDFMKVSLSDRYLKIYSSVTPDELVGNPKQLSSERTKAGHRIFDNKLRELSQCDAHAIYKEDVKSWGDVLKAVKSDRAVPARDDLIQVLESLPSLDNHDNSEIVRRLQTVGGGEAYQYLCEKTLPAMRKVSVVLCYLNLPSKPVETIAVTPEEEMPIAASVDSIAPSSDNEALQTKTPINKEFDKNQKEVQRVPKSSKIWADISSNLAVKTNLLYDVALVPNIGIEWAFAKNLSVSADWMYAWWSRDTNHRYWRVYGGNLELKYWLNQKAGRKLTGHHLGVYGGVVTYDFEFGGRGYQGDRWSYMAGLSYGYSLPIVKKLNLDFEIGLGYLGGEYYEYDYNNDAQLYFWQQTKKRKWIGPTKVEISLVWLLGK